MVRCTASLLFLHLARERNAPISRDASGSDRDDCTVAPRRFIGKATVEELAVVIEVGAVEVWGNRGEALSWQGRAIHGRRGWAGSVRGDADWDALLAERRHLTLRFPAGSTRRFLVSYVDHEENAVHVYGEGDLPETRQHPGTPA